MTDPSKINVENVSPWATSIRVGLIGGLILVLYTLLGNMTGFTIPTSMGGGILLLVISIGLSVGIGFFAIRQHRDQNLGGYISLGQAFLVGFIAIFLASIISGLFNVLYMAMIDPGFADQAVAQTGQWLESLGMSEADIEKQMKDMREGLTPPGILRQTLISGLIASAVISLILGAIMKKDRPVTEELLDS